MQGISRQFTKIDKIVPSGTECEVPPYKVGANQILFFYNGVLCIEGEKYQYTEIGENVDISTKILTNFTFKPNSEVTLIVFAL